MTVIELPDEQAAALKAIAAAQGLTLQAWFAKLVAEKPSDGWAETPFKTGRGILAQYGPASSAEDIDENRREMFRNFGHVF